MVALDIFRFEMLTRGVIAPDSPVLRWLDLVGEMSLQSWFSSSLLLVSAALAAILATREERRTVHIGWIGLAAGFTLMSADESISIHEHLADFVLPGLVLDGPFRFTWVVVGIPIAAVLSAIYLPFLLRLPRRAAALLLAAALLYLGGALGLELVGAELFSHDETRPFYRLVSSAEETLEMFGLVVLIHALLNLLVMSPPTRVEIR